jgi:hypothetical protein
MKSAEVSARPKCAISEKVGTVIDLQEDFFFWVKCCGNFVKHLGFTSFPLRRMAKLVEKVKSMKNRIVGADSLKNPLAEIETASDERNELSSATVPDRVVEANGQDQANVISQANGLAPQAHNKFRHSAFWFCLFFAVSGLYGISIFLAGVIRRKMAIAEYPDAEFLSPSADVIVAHWIFVIGATTAFGFCLYLVVVGDRASRALQGINALWCVMTLAIFLIYFGVDSDTVEYKLSNRFVSIPTLTRQQRQFITRHPYTALSGEISRSGSSCTPRAGVALAVNSTDASDFPNISFAGKGPAVRLFRYSVTVNWTAESLLKIRQMETDLGRCREDEYPDRALSHRDSIEGIPEIGFVWEDEDATRGLGRRSALAWRWLFGGVFYSYSVASIPVVPIHIQKNNAVVGHIPGCLETVWDC